MTFAQPKMHRHRPIDPLKLFKHALTEMFEGVAADLGSKTLQSLNTQAVISGCRQCISRGRLAQIKMQLQINTEPLTVFTLMVEDPHMGPEAEIVDPDYIQWRGDVAHPCKSTWLKRRTPEA